MWDDEPAAWDIDDASAEQPAEGTAEGGAEGISSRLFLKRLWSFDFDSNLS